jgi:hypothetical protein
MARPAASGVVYVVRMPRIRDWNVEVSIEYSRINSTRTTLRRHIELKLKS